MSIDLRRLAALAAAIVTAIVIVVACGPAAESPGAAGAAPPGPQAKTSADPQLLAEGKAAWRSCAKCHCVTDPHIPADQDWVAMNEETTCIAKGEPVPRLRKSIMAHLRDPDALRPVLVRAGLPIAADKTGKITLPATAGSAYLRADRDSVKAGAPSKVRLVWEATEGEKTTFAPAGHYDVINFWFYRRAGADGSERWMVTATNVNGCTTANVGANDGADDTEILDVEPILYGKLTAEQKEDGHFAISFSCQDQGGSRMTLSRDGRVVIPGYRITDAAGKVVAEGRFVVI